MVSKERKGKAYRFFYRMRIFFRRRSFMEKKILVAIDGSVYSSNSLDYLIRLFSHDDEAVIHLLAVISSAGSDQNWMFDVDPLRQQSPVMDRKTRVAGKYLQDAKERLLRNGFMEEQVEVQTTSSRANIATAIHHAAVQGSYDALLVGRRGMGKVGEMFFGSVSSQLLESCHEIPLWIIDGEVTSTHFLLAVHALPVSLMAADHLAFIMQANPQSEIYLYHSSQFFGNDPQVSREDFYAQWGKDWCAQHLDLENHLFGAHTRILTEGGVAGERIKQLAIQSDLDAGHDLLRQAKKHHCGTIVLGRRGRETNKGFFGGVSERTMQKAQNQAVWLVG
ncbi:MAG TPA: universal stress protein [Desulfobulbus sp.]|nr:universal stress protein [Desulfobulbus sp.]